MASFLEKLKLVYHIVHDRVYVISNSYTMGCPPVRGDNPRALASRLSYVQVDKYNTYISVDLAHRELFRAKSSKGWYKLSKRQITKYAEYNLSVYCLSPFKMLKRTLVYIKKSSSPCSRYCICICGVAFSGILSGYSHFADNTST